LSFQKILRIIYQFINIQYKRFIFENTLKILFFLLSFARALFFSYNFVNTSNSTFTDILLSFLYGSRHDASIAGYILMIPALFLIFSAYINSKTIARFFIIYTSIIIVISSIIISIDIELYRNWGFRIDSTPLHYLANPKEAMASTDFSIYLLLTAIFIVQVALFIFIYKRFISQIILKFEKSNYFSSLVFALIAGSLILPIRGSIGIAPINSGTVYFSKKNQFANHAAVNAVWNFGFSISENDNVQPINFFDDAKAQEIFSDLYPSTTNTKSVLRVKRPNVVLIIMESYTSKIVGCLGGTPGITPNLDRIAKSGILFDNFFASGDRTDKGLIAVLSGYPSQPTSAIMKFSNKTRKLPTISKSLETNGYNTEWVCGFNTDFANIKSYIYSSGYDKVVDINNFPGKSEGLKWGVPDEFVFEKLFDEIENEKEPFFKIFMTLSSHEPFEVPMKDIFPLKTEADRFLNAAFYTDKSLGEFFDKLRNSKEWDSTLLILVADHGSRLPYCEQIHGPLKYRIPMIWAGVP
jgi:phosphoglycerol transferase MdoB-like AlkP superfamily enzyme